MIANVVLRLFFNSLIFLMGGLKEEGTRNLLKWRCAIFWIMFEIICDQW